MRAARLPIRRNIPSHQRTQGMPRKFLRRFLPAAQRIHGHWLLRRLGSGLRHPRLWRLNRRSVSGATAVGLFVAFLPLPFQVVMAAVASMWTKVNLPLSVAWVFVTNPLTMGPAYYLCYKAGALLLGAPPVAPSQGQNLAWLIDSLGQIWQPLVVGSLAIGTVCALSGYCLVQLAWRSWILYRRGSLARQLAVRASARKF